ncbi:MAG: hypothetical protein Q4D80_02900, partial [Pseudomonadota bacterium]|nr:hypothetical protein [Pseudomonadota bacterium]
DVTSCGADYKLDKNGTANGKDCGKCIRKETCADYSLINEAACDTSKNTFTFSRSDDYGNRCGTCAEEDNPEGIIFRFYIEAPYAQYAGNYYVCEGPLTSQEIRYIGQSHPCNRLADSVQRDICYSDPTHTAWWRGAFTIYEGYMEEREFTLPVELKIVVTYDVPIYIEHGYCPYNTHSNFTGWGNQDSDVYAPKTVTFTIPKGTIVDFFHNSEVSHHLPAIDFSEDAINNPQHIKIEYYIDGEKLLPEEFNIKKVGNYTYVFNVDYEGPWDVTYHSWSDHWSDIGEGNNWEGYKE